MLMSGNLIKLGGFCLLAGLLSWRILVVGLADHYLAQGTPEATAAALRWRANQPTALYARGQALSEREPNLATPLLQKAVGADPTNALTYLALAQLAARAGRSATAVELAETADILGPMSSPVLHRSAVFWAEQGRLDRVLERWSVLLRTSPETATQLYPALLAIAEDPATRPLLLPLLEHPPDWWDRFFAHAAAKATRPATLTFLYHHRHRGGALPTASEQRIYLERLWKDGRWPEAYVAWLGGLDQRAQAGLGQVYNGGFDLPVTGIGFDWTIAPTPGITVETSETYGSHGGRALHLAFQAPKVRFKHLSQALYLEPGRYQLQGRVRLDGLAPREGVRWALRCTKPEGPPLATSPTFSGKDDWQLFLVAFEVPARDCPLQHLRLEQEEQPDTAGETGGEIWFDDLAISRRG